MSISLRSVERWLWYIFLATFAWQTRMIVWKADRVFNEWRSATIYLSDVLMIALVIIAIVTARGRFRVRGTMADRFLALFFLAAALSVLHAVQQSVGIVQLIRLVQFVAFFYYLRCWAWQRFNISASALAIVVGALAQAAIGIGQYAVRHDLGLRWLGETLLRTDMRGVAVFYDTAGDKILRAYGTLPHPNVLAAYLLLAFYLAVWLWLHHWSKSRIRTFLWQVAVAILLVGQYLTFSRTVIAVWACSLAVLCVAMYVPRFSRAWPHMPEIRRRFRVVLLTIGVVTVGFVGLSWPQVVARSTISGADEAVRLRVMYNHEAASSGLGNILQLNWTGVGIGNFTTWLSQYDPALPPHLIQPAHNVYLLAYSEIGLFGLISWAVWLLMVVRLAWVNYREQPLLRVGIIVLLVGMLGTGMLDHFYWTLQQGRVLWWSVLALAAGRA